MRKMKMFSKMKTFDVDEILYEITLKCNKNCSYCGSKFELMFD